MSAGGPETKLKQLEQEFGEAQMARATYEGSWYLNVAYYEGDQWLCWNGNQLYKPKLRNDRVLITDNRIQPAVRTEVAKLSKTHPSFEATPSSPGDDAVEGARRATRVLEAKWGPDELALQGKLIRALNWSRICGAGFWKITWDSSAGPGRDVLVGPDGKVARDDNEAPLDPSMLGAIPEGHPLREALQKKRINKGDVRVDVRSPFQVFPDPLADSFDECQHFFEEVITSTEYVLKRYGVKLQPDADFTAGLVQARTSSRSRALTTKRKGVRLREMWQKATAEHPQGRHVVWAKERILVDEANPYRDHDGAPYLPYVMIPGIDVPGRFWPTSIVEQLRPVQTELNKTKSQIAENRNRFGNPSMLVSKQANVKYTGLPGEKIEFDDTTQNATPQFLQPPEMPGYVQNLIAEIQQSIQEISGQHEVSSGTVPSGVTAAAAINLLQEGDDTRLGPSVWDLESALSLAGTMILRLIAEYYTDERVIRLSGQDDEYEIFSFKGDMLNGQTRVRVPQGSMTPRSKAAKQALMQDMFNLMTQYGMRFEQRALRKFFNQYEVGGLEALLGDLDRDEAQVNRENRKLYANEPVAVNPLVDNHEAHIAGHREEMKSLRYEEACRRDPTTAQRFLAHLQQHLDAAAAVEPPPVDEQGMPLPPPPPAPAGAGGTPPPADLLAALSQVSSG